MQLLALVVGAGVPYAYLLYQSLRDSGDWDAMTATTQIYVRFASWIGLAITPMHLLFAWWIGLAFWIGWLLFFLRIVSRETLTSLNLQVGSRFGDIRDGVLLCVAVSWRAAA